MYSVSNKTNVCMSLLATRRGLHLRDDCLLLLSLSLSMLLEIIQFAATADDYNNESPIAASGENVPP